MKKITIILFFGILLLGFILRLYRFDNPVADWHSWRQVDTSSVSRIYVEEGINLLEPRYHDLSNVPSGLENPQGYRFVEFPIYNAAQAALFSYIGVISLEQWGRMLTIIASILTITFLFLLLRRYTDDKVALFGAFLYAVIPFNVYFGRVILPDPWMVASIMGGIYFFDLWLEHYKSKKRIFPITFFLLSLVFTAMAFLFKPFALFFVLPMAATAYISFGKRMFINWKLWLFAIISILPLLAWRIWIQQYPEGIPVSDWLFNGGGIRFKGAFFYWIFEKRIGELILTFWGSALLVIGVLINSNSEKVFGFRKGQMLLFWSFLVSSLAYLVIIARGNVQHDYYQILIVSTLVMFASLGVKLFLDPPHEIIKKYISYPTLIVIVLFIFAFGWYGVRDFFNINRGSIILAGQAVDDLTPKDSLVIANYEGDTTFLYQTGRRGWASYTHELPKMVEMGAEYLVIADPTESDLGFGETYEILDQKDEYIIFDLTKTK